MHLSCWCLKKMQTKAMSKRMKPCRFAQSFTIGSVPTLKFWVNLRGSTWDVGLKRCVSYFRTTPYPVAVTTRIVPFLVAIVTITGWEVDRDHTIDGENPHLGCRNSMKFLYSTDQFEWRYIPKMYPRKKKCLVRNSNFQLPFLFSGV